MTTFTRYSIGNGLRGVCYFKARTLNEAWRKGCAKFNRAFPSKRGRWVTLEQQDGTLIPTTRWVISQSRLKKEKRHFSNHELPTRGFVAVASGMSNEELILP